MQLPWCSLRLPFIVIVTRRYLKGLHMSQVYARLVNNDVYELHYMPASVLLSPQIAPT